MTGLRSVIVGVDASPEAAHAAAVGWQIAVAADAGCQVIHGVRRPRDVPVTMPPNVDVGALEYRVTAAALEEVRGALIDTAPPRAIEQLEIHVGHPIATLRRAIGEHDAGLVVLGGKRHGRIVRWLGGSTAHHAVRALDVPVLVTAGAGATFARILAAVDLSAATRPTLDAALLFRDLFGADLRVLHAVEPFAHHVEQLPADLAPEARADVAEREADHVLADVGGGQTFDRVIRHGRPVDAIAAEAGTWPADLIVVGSHGRGWVDRIVIGSTTERLLNQLPASLLVVPVSGVLAASREGP